MDTHPVPEAMKTVNAPNSAMILIIITSSFYCYNFFHSTKLTSCYIAIVPMFEFESSGYIFHSLYNSSSEVCHHV